MHASVGHLRESDSRTASTLDYTICTPIRIFADDLPVGVSGCQAILRRVTIKLKLLTFAVSIRVFKQPLVFRSGYPQQQQYPAQGYPQQGPPQGYQQGGYPPQQNYGPQPMYQQAAPAKGNDSATCLTAW